MAGGGRRCVLRAAPPEPLGPARGRPRPAVAWNGSRVGVTWTDLRDGENAVLFAQAGVSGERVGAAVRVSERGFEAWAPTLAWEGTGWAVVFEGGVGKRGDLYQARVNAQGIATGHPWRITRGRRDDMAPSLVSTGPGYGLAWVSAEEDRRWSVYGWPRARWDGPRAEPVRLLNTSLTLASPTLLWTGQAWAIACIAARREASSVLFLRMEANGTPRGSVTRVTDAPVGGLDLDGRLAAVWDGSAFVVAWSELREGAWRVLAQRVTPRGNPLGASWELSTGAPEATAPALASLGDGSLVVALEVAREGQRRVWVRVVGHEVTERLELQDADGEAWAPAVVSLGGGLAVATASRRGVSLHRVELGPCP